MLLGAPSDAVHVLAHISFIYKEIMISLLFLIDKNSFQRILSMR